MSEVDGKRISIDQVEVDMVLAEDVMNSSGMLLIPKGTTLTQKHIFRMQLYQVLSVVIRDDSTKTSENESEASSIYSTSQNSRAFKQFESTYTDQHKKVQSELDSISEGKAIKLNELFSLSKNLIDTLDSQRDLFNFLCHLKIHDDFTYTHCLNVSMLCNIFGQWLNMSNEDIENLTIAGLLHDIGKIEMDQEILNKPGKLTKDEFDQIKQHTLIGYNMIKNQNIPYEVKMGILLHHEKYDGSGYPFGFKQDQIHDFAKIIAIADIYDAMTSERSYHKRYSPFKVIRMFEQETYGLLDTKFLFIFLENIAHNYIGAPVRLSSGEVGTIVFIHKSHPSRPIVQVDNVMIDLQNELELDIEEML